MIKYIVFLCIYILSSLFSIAFAQLGKTYAFSLVNMIPFTRSEETFFDSEPNIAINPQNLNQIVCSAFTPNPGDDTTKAPVFVSDDGGDSWSLQSILPSNNGMTNDISLKFGTTSNQLYAGILKGGEDLHGMVLSSNAIGSSSMMKIVANFDSILYDQPFISAVTHNSNDGNSEDNVFTGINNLSKFNSNGTGQTAQVLIYKDDLHNKGACSILNIEPRSTNGQDFPSVRIAVHPSGVAYAAYLRWVSGSIPNENVEIRVAKDLHFGLDSFGVLTDSKDHLPGINISSSKVPAFQAYLGNNRFGGSLAIAVDPGNVDIVYVAWCDRVGSSDITLHLRQSVNGGISWGRTDLLTLTNTMLPGIAVNDSGILALLYQQLTYSGSTKWWETHFQTSVKGLQPFTDNIIAKFLNSDLDNSNIDPALGDYLDLQAVKENFYGVFSASNYPDYRNFPVKVQYQRLADFTTNTLLSPVIDGSGKQQTVAISVDPFFFSAKLKR